jgi:alkaline phosphatase D
MTFMTALEELPASDGWSRRRFVGAMGGLAGLAALAQVPLEEGALAAPRRGLGGYPFTLGVASGDPTPDGFVLWTRLAPDPLAPAGAGCRRRRLPSIGWWPRMPR